MVWKPSITTLRYARKRIHHWCKVGIDKSVFYVTIWHHSVSLMMPKWPSGQICLSAPDAHIRFLYSPLQEPNSVVRYFIDPSNSQDIRDWFQVDSVLGIVSLRQDMRDYYFNNNTRFTVQVRKIPSTLINTLYWLTRFRGYRMFFMLNSAKREI